MSADKLPISWANPPISDCCDLNPKIDKSQFDDTQVVHFIPMPAVEALTNKVDVSATRPFGEVKKGYTPFKSGDVIFAKITPCMENGKMAVVPELPHELAFGSTEFHVIRPRSGLDAFWFFNFLSSRSYRATAEHNMTGAVGQRRVPIDFIAKSRIPLPPLAEQKRIVAKIEELFSELESGEESLRVARRQLGVYRQSLLKQAFEGKLTRSRKVELVPLRDLITGLSQGWSPKCELNRTPKFDEWAIIKTTAIQHCSYDDSEAKPLPPPFEPRPSIEIKDGDFLMTRKGPRSRAGVSCYVRKTRPLLMVCDTVYRFRCIEEKVHPLYLELALNSPDVLHAIDRQKAGISESGLSLTHTKIGTVEIPLCSLPEQQEIVRILDEQFEVVERNEREIDAALKRSEALRQSILKKAFTGQLVPQDPSDEPASALLARLRTESVRTAKPPNGHAKNL